MQPQFMPVTTFGEAYPLDRLIRPFLPRVARTLMVSYHYARQIGREALPLPLFVDSGGFSLLFEGASIVERADGTAMIERVGDDGETEQVRPEDVLSLQRRHARYGCPLDFPIPTGLTDRLERERRIRLTQANAAWAIGQSRSEGLELFAPVQGWDEESYDRSAGQMLALGYRDLAIGGMVPRISDPQFICRVVARVRARMAPHARLHVFGIGKPETIRATIAAGASSTDSSSYVKAAADGIRWDGETVPQDPTPLERAHAAVANAARCEIAASKA